MLRHPRHRRGFPLTVFPDALGIGQEGRESLLPYGNFVFNSMGPRNDLLEASLAELPPLNEWATRQSARGALMAEGFGAAIYAAADRGEIGAEEAPLLVKALLSAGVDTTVNGIGAALAAFASHPGEWAKLHANPALARRFARLEAAGAAVRRHNNTLRGLRALPLRLVPA